ncbi:EI24 domain-containing protein [Crocinitomicaceae bacterium]|jgi:CysZ protein|nr:EI24 domain-containing protein [Crocinitomicaceae bacterium]
MKTIGHHFTAFQWALQQFSKGKFLLYFIPGLLIALGFWYLETWAHGFIGEGESNGWWNSIVSGTGTVLEFIFKQIAIFFILTVLSPVNTFLSEAVDTELTGKAVGFDFIRFFNDFIRMIFVVIIAVFFEFLFMGVWAIFAWIFSLQVLNPTVFFLSASFFYGFAFYDYSLERYEIGLGGSFRFCKKYFLPTLVTGIIFMGLYYIPIVGLAIAPVLATVISTHVFLKSTGRLDQIKQQKVNEANETV